MTLVDAGPLVALADADDPLHHICVRTLASVNLPLVTTWVVFTEAMYLIGRQLGCPGQRALWDLQQGDRLRLVDLSPRATARAAALMDKYADRPMDLDDATLVALAEQRKERRVFTLDSDFHVYRLHGRVALDILPQ